MSWSERFSFSITCFFVVIVCANLVNSESIFGIGTRIIGDQLLLKDVLQTPPLSLTEVPVIRFNYAIIEPITYIEIESDKNVYAAVKFSYEDHIVEGTISYISGHVAEGEQKKAEPFEVLIQIYGFNDTMLNVNPAYILNKDQIFNGILKPKNKINQVLQGYQSLNLNQENLNALDEQLKEYIDEIDGNDDDEDGDDIDYEDIDFNNEYDKTIEQGQRQNGDILVYETNQTSVTSSKVPSNHSVTFYYIDIYYITCVKFTIYEHYLDNPLDDYIPPVVEYEHISPTTLKAVVTDHRTTSLFVEMKMYGFHPTQLPVDYKPFLSNGQSLSSSASVFVPSTARPISSLTQLKILMNAQQSTNLQHLQQQQKQEEQEQQQPNELGHQISPSNKSDVNCLQQVLSPQSNNGCTFTSHWAIFNLIVTIFITIVSV